jgi:hypothetical protein
MLHRVFSMVFSKIMNDNNQALHVIFGTAALGQAVMRKLLAQNQRGRMISRSSKAIVPKIVEVMRVIVLPPVLFVRDPQLFITVPHYPC